MKALIKLNDKKSKFLHMAIIILGTIFVALPCFHTNLWFDESYTIGITRFPIPEIYSIGSNDVHPILYYILVRIIVLITGGSIIAIRLFSIIPLIVMGILGYTHIRKDFGEKAGLIFSFLSFFFPACFMYAGEIRMYTWAMMFVTVMAIYTYRLIKYREVNNKNWIIFSIFSLASAYTHYYGLASAFVINLILFIYFLVKSIKNKNTKNSKYLRNLKRWIVSAVFQIIAYIPWIGVVINSSKTGGFWIGFPNFPQMLEFQFTGNLYKHIPSVLSWIYTIVFLLYIIYAFKKNWNRDEIKPAKLAILTYFLILVFLVLVSLIIEPILYARYLLTITGIFIFVITILLAKENPKITLSLCVFTVIVSLVANINLININYDKSNDELFDYMKNNIKEDDIFIADSSLVGLSIFEQLKIDGDHLYFWDKDRWGVEEAYKAFGKSVYDFSSLEDSTERIWFVSRDAENYKKLLEELDNRVVIENTVHQRTYQDDYYCISLIERKP